MNRFVAIAVAIFFLVEPSSAFFFQKHKEKFFMESQLIPIELKVKQGLTVAASLKYNNKFACLSGGAEFAIATLDANLHVKVEVVRENVPGVDYSGVFGADETGKLMWCKSGWREAIIINTESKKVIQKIASYNGNSFIGAFYPVVAKEEFIYVWVKIAKGPMTFPVFDFTQNDPVAVIDKLYLASVLSQRLLG